MIDIYQKNISHKQIQYVQSDFEFQNSFEVIKVFKINSSKQWEINWQTLDNNFTISDVLLSFAQFNFQQSNNNHYIIPEISQDKKSIIFKGNLYSTFYYYLVLDLSIFNNVQIQHDKVEILKADKIDEQSEIIQYIFYKDLNKNLEKYKIKEVYAFLTGFSTGNNSGYKGIAIDLSASVEQNRIKLSIKTRKSYIDLNVIQYNYLLSFIDDLNPSQYEIKSVFNQQLSPDKYPSLFNKSNGQIRQIDIELDIQQEQILKDYKKFLFLGPNKIDYLIIQDQKDTFPSYNMSFANTLVNNKVQFIARIMDNSKSNGLSILVIQIYYKQYCNVNEYLYNNQCYPQCPKAFYQGQCYEQYPQGKYFLITE